jgi:glutamate dehydrogenase/leucine dehydrogenase
MIPFAEINEKIWDVPCDIFVPGASSKLVSRNQIDRLLSNGCSLISCGANVPFVDDKVFFGETADFTDNQISVIPDFIANCGMARVFAYLMNPDIDLTDAAIFNDVSNIISDFLQKMKDENTDNKQITKRALSLILSKIN